MLRPQAVLRPYLNSKFEVVDNARSQRVGVTFGSAPHARSGSTFRRWLYLWMKVLVSQASGMEPHMSLLMGIDGMRGVYSAGCPMSLSW